MQIVEKLVSDVSKLSDFYCLLAEVPGAARVNLQPAEHLKNVSFSF